jgi:hypothetical protein
MEVHMSVYYYCANQVSLLIMCLLQKLLDIVLVSAASDEV